MGHGAWDRSRAKEPTTPSRPKSGDCGDPRALLYSLRLGGHISGPYDRDRAHILNGTLHVNVSHERQHARASVHMDTRA